jgi:hypothetical protein
MGYIPIITGILGLLVMMWVPLTSGENGIEARRVLAWCAIIAVTLLIPTVGITAAAMQITARLLAPDFTDTSSFVTQIAWYVGIFSAIYPLIWGVKFYPRLEVWVSKRLVTSPVEKK